MPHKKEKKLNKNQYCRPLVFTLCQGWKNELIGNMQKRDITKDFMGIGRSIYLRLA